MHSSDLDQRVLHIATRLVLAVHFGDTGVLLLKLSFSMHEMVISMGLKINLKTTRDASTCIQHTTTLSQYASSSTGLEDVAANSGVDHHQDHGKLHTQQPQDVMLQLTAHTIKSNRMQKGSYTWQTTTGRHAVHLLYQGGE